MALRRPIIAAGAPNKPLSIGTTVRTSASHPVGSALLSKSDDLGRRRVELLTGFPFAGDEVVHLVAEFRPALRTEMFFETFFGLATDGKTNRKGLPNPLRLAVLAREYQDELHLARPPLRVQRALFGPWRRWGGSSVTEAGIQGKAPILSPSDRSQDRAVGDRPRGGR